MPDVWDQFPDYTPPQGGGYQPPTPPPAMPGVQQAPIPPAPPGALPGSWRTEMQGQTAKDSGEALTKAEGAREALQATAALRKIISDAPNEAFGPYMGSDLTNRIRSFVGAIPGIGSIPDYAGNTDADLTSWHDRLAGGYARVALPKIKELIGTVPRGEAQAPLVEHAMSTIGGTTLTDKKSALKNLEDAQVASYDAIAEGIRRGRVNPSEYLQTPKTPEEAQALGRGALYIHPKTGAVMRNPI